MKKIKNLAKIEKIKIEKDKYKIEQLQSLFGTRIEFRSQIDYDRTIALITLLVHHLYLEKKKHFTLSCLHTRLCSLPSAISGIFIFIFLIWTFHILSPSKFLQSYVY